MLLYSRPISPEDESFLFQLYASTRSEEIALWGWDEATSHSFLMLQWTAQQKSYAAQYPEMDHRIIELDHLRIGRIIISHNEHSITLVDLSLLAEYRNHNYGTILLQQLQHEATKYNKKLHLSVLKTNRANSLYKRMGFIFMGCNDLYNFLEWTPQ